MSSVGTRNKPTDVEILSISIIVSTNCTQLLYKCNLVYQRKFTDFLLWFKGGSINSEMYGTTLNNVLTRFCQNETVISTIFSHRRQKRTKD